jgi:type I restriction enzyme S subunit
VPKILAISGCINDGSVALVDLSPNISKDFLYYFFTSQTEGLRARIRQGMGQPNLNTNLVTNIQVPIGSLDEQQAIAANLDDQMARTRHLLNAIRGGIARLQEYRTALISAAVTGQIDVRQEVSP